MQAQRPPSRFSAPRLMQPQSAVCSVAEPTYTIGTLVTDHKLYEGMLASMRAGGFDDATTEYIYVDNTGPEQTSAHRGLNAILNAARGRYVILCHQDVELIEHDRATLDQRLADLHRLDPCWGLAGNAGGVVPGELALRITDPHGQNQHVGELPARVVSLDENLIIVRGDARIGFSRDLESFHFYGADICLAADIMGYNAYVIDFHVKHLSGGRKDRLFDEAEAAFRAKWSRALRGRWIQTTCALVRVTGDPLSHVVGRLTELPLTKLARRLPHARGWKKPEGQDAEQGPAEATG
jgi:hypothetical protein